MTFSLVLDPNGKNPQRIPFTVSEGDIEDAIDFGRVKRSDPLDKQIKDAAYHKVMELAVDRRVLDSFWLLVCNGEVIARNHG
jgi:hypothetical protein